MKAIMYIPLIIFFLSCNSKITSIDSTESLKDLKEILKDKFGENAYYTGLNISNSDYGPIVNVSQTDTPSSLKMTEWNLYNGDWNQTSDVILEISDNTKAKDFMFQLNKIIDFDIIIKIVEEAKNKVIEEKKIAEVVVQNININAPKDGDFSKMNYFITINPKSGGTNFNFWYQMDGTLSRFDY